VWLLSRPLSYLLLFARHNHYRREMPEMFDGGAALAAILVALEKDGYV
jgi:hypothetical protein